MEKLAQYIDSTLLKPNATKTEFLKLFEDANAHQFKAVCVPPCYISLAEKYCTGPLICTVVGFPNGYNTTRMKVAETIEALSLGADEIDFVNNVTFIKSQEWEKVKSEYRQIVKAAQGCTTKLILETSLLTDNEMDHCIQLAVESGVSFIKTSTGFGSRGASENDMFVIQSALKKIFQNRPITVGIKASGGMRTWEDVQKMISLGATRIGTSQAVTILNKI